MKRKSFYIVAATTLCLGALLAIGSMQGVKKLQTVTAEDMTYTLTFSSTNKVTDSQIKTPSGTTLWVKGDSNSGVTWNNGSGKIAIAKHGYIQNLTAINGIKSVTVNLQSGSLSLYHSWVEPSDLETAEYGEDYVFTSTYTYNFTDTLPSRFRLIANSDAVVNSISVKYSCTSGAEDPNSESIELGLENGYIDAGSNGRLARTAFVTSDTYDTDSKRSLKLTFDGTTNNYVSFNTQRNATSELTDDNIDFAHSKLSFMAKFSSNIVNQDISVCANGVVNDDWTDSTYIKANRDMYYDNGWYHYTLDFSQFPFPGNRNGIRLNIRPDGVDSSNKSTAWVLLDDVQTSYSSVDNRYQLETTQDSWENMVHDDGWENTTFTYDNQVTFGSKSRSSMLIKPNVNKSKNYSLKWFTAFSPEIAANREILSDIDLSSGIITFNYKPMNVVSNADFIVSVVQNDWATHTIGCVGTYLKDGWYSANIDLGRTGAPEGVTIRLVVGWDITDSNLSKAKVWIDNLKYHETTGYETLAQGWENMYIDDSWSECTPTKVFDPTASDTSVNSLKLKFDKSIGWANQGFICISPEAEDMQSQINGYIGRLQAKFMFTSNITDHSIRLVLVDDDWKAARWNVDISPIGNGWYQLDLDLSTLDFSKRFHGDDEYDATNIIRIGFGFNGISDSNKANTTVWVDDIFYTTSTPAAASSYSNATIWQAYDTEAPLQTEAATSGRTITDSNPLLIEGLKNDTQATQLMIRTATSKPISSYNLRAGTLYSNTGAKITPNAFSISAAKYVYVPSNSSEKKGGSYGWKGAGYYPDALVPIDAVVKASENTIAASKEQSLWISLNIPKYIKAGTYTGDFILTINGTDYRAPMKVVVHDATIPEQRENRSLMLLWYDQIEHALGSDHYNRETRLQYYNYFANRNISAGEIRFGDWYDDPESFAEYYALHVAHKDSIDTYRLPIHDGTYQEVYGYLDALIDKNLELAATGDTVNFFKKLVTYYNDEPHTVAMWNECKTYDTNFHNAINALKDRLNGYPELKSSFENMLNIVPFNQDLDTVDLTAMSTPCPTFEHVNTTAERNAYLNGNYDHVWWYGCILPNLPYPSYHLDTKMTGVRLITWMQYNLGIEGNLYFCINYSQRWDNSWDNPETRDIWSDPLCQGNGACDGRLVYPGLKYGISDPISTQRLEEIIASYEDYEYFKLIEAKIDVYNANHGTSLTAKQLVANTNSLSTFIDGTKLRNTSSASPANLMSYRRAILNLLDELY